MLLQIMKAQIDHKAKSADSVIWSWCRSELAHWEARRLDYPTVLSELRRRSEKNSMEFLFSIRGGHVSIAPKAPESPKRVPIWRPPLYLNFLNEVVNQFCPELEVDILINVNDGNINRELLPIFSFQKPMGSTSILLPDVDFLEFGFYYPNPGFTDSQPYGAKACSAVFAGSTTGALVNKETLDNRSHPRIRSARFFRGNPKVDFRLPVLTPMPDDAKRQLLEEGFGKGDKLSYHEQFQHKFLISMDGWGATCSRLPITLRSNSVLLKYASPHRLYYFNSLTAWLHYIPINVDEDVNSIIRIEEQDPGSFAAISESGKAFADTYLTRMQAMKYTAWLLRGYANSFASSIAYSLPNNTRPHRPLDATNASGRSPALNFIVHVSFRGNVWCQMNQWAGGELNEEWIEGFIIEPSFGIRPSEIEYRSIDNEGLASQAYNGGMFTGTKGKHRPLSGLSIRTIGEASNLWECEYTAKFSDGEVVGPVRQGIQCQSSKNLPLTSVKLNLILKHDDPSSAA